MPPTCRVAPVRNMASPFTLWVVLLQGCTSILRLRANGVNSKAQVAFGVVGPIPGARIEFVAPRGVFIARVGRRQPVVAALARNIEDVPSADAGGREEDRFSIRTSDKSAIHTILNRPLSRAIIYQFTNLIH